MKRKQGTIIAPSSLNVLSHELDTARALADAGMDVEFVPRVKGNRSKSADIIANGVLWEMKSPVSGKLRVVEKHIRAALHQSRDIVFDSRRMKGVSDRNIKEEVTKWANNLTHVRRLIYVNKAGEVVIIK